MIFTRDFDPKIVIHDNSCIIVYILLVMMLLFIIMAIVMYNRIVFQLKNKDMLLLVSYLTPLGSRAAWQRKVFFLLFRLLSLFSMKADTLCGDHGKQISHITAEISVVTFEAENLGS